MNLKDFFNTKTAGPIIGTFFLIFSLFFNIKISNTEQEKFVQLAQQFLQEFQTTSQDSKSDTVDQSSSVLGLDDSSLLVWVASVTDGDTIKISLNDTTKTVRVVNINTPETVDPRKPVQCMGVEASAKMSELVLGKKVVLQVDPTQQNKDRYGRLLRFVYLEDGTDVGLKLIELGFAESAPYGSKPHAYLQAYEAAQKNAQLGNLGLWNAESCT